VASTSRRSPREGAERHISRHPAQTLLLDDDQEYPDSHTTGHASRRRVVKCLAGAGREGGQRRGRPRPLAASRLFHGRRRRVVLRIRAHGCLGHDRCETHRSKPVTLRQWCPIRRRDRWLQLSGPSHWHFPGPEAPVSSRRRPQLSQTAFGPRSESKHGPRSSCHARASRPMPKANSVARLRAISTSSAIGPPSTGRAGPPPRRRRRGQPRSAAGSRHGTVDVLSLAVRLRIPPSRSAHPRR